MAGWNELAVSAAAVAVGGFRAHCLSRCFSPDAPAWRVCGAFALVGVTVVFPAVPPDVVLLIRGLFVVTTATGCGLGQALSGPT